MAGGHWKRCAQTGVERFVTVAMREVIFHKPVFVGDLMSLYAEVMNLGTTSITVRVIGPSERGRRHAASECESLKADG